MAALDPGWSALVAVLWAAGGAGCLVAAVWQHGRGTRFGPARLALTAAVAMTALWALTGAALGPRAVGVGLAEGLRNLAWVYALYRLFGIDGRDAEVRPVRPLLAALAFVEVADLLAVLLLQGPGQNPALYQTLAALRLLVAIGGLVLAHNLYGGAGQSVRLVIRWPVLAFVTLWIFDLNHYAIAYLAGSEPQGTALLRGLLALPVAGLVMLGTAGGSEALRFRPSRTMAFQSVSLVLIGGYLLLMISAAQGVAAAGGDYAALLQAGFVASCVAGVVLAAMSPRLRGWLRVTVLKHLFKYRYDYRAEWLRFTRTIGQAGAGSAPLDQRVIQALADVVDSTAGLLFVPGDAGALDLAAGWQWRLAGDCTLRLAPEQLQRLEREAYIVDLDQLRTRPDAPAPLPDWLLQDRRAWAAVPLLHFDRLAGLVVLARPAYARPLDWEDFDMLRVVGRQLASYLAEQAGQEALAEARRFDEFHRRIAFVMHDIKNLASQLGLLAGNAERHADNPAFRADMLVTLRNSTDKLNALVARLSRYGTPPVAELGPVDAGAVLRGLARQLGRSHPVTVVGEGDTVVAAQRETLEQVLLHLLQNAIDATADDAPVVLSAQAVGLNGVIEVIDHGCGMSADFVRARLFKPFDSTKPGGFGIGACEARELVRAMNGRLEVDSREGLGTRFTVILPLAGTAALIDQLNQAGPAQAQVA